MKQNALAHLLGHFTDLLERNKLKLMCFCFVCIDYCKNCQQTCMALQKIEKTPPPHPKDLQRD
jgi:hypothetical protein